MHTSSEPLLVVMARGGEPAQVRLIGEIDVTTAPDVRRAIEQFADSATSGVELDLRRVDFIDSTGLNCLLDARRRLGGGLRVVGVSSAVSRILDLACCRAAVLGDAN